MTLAVSIAGAIAVAVTARLMYLFFLSGKTISNTTLAGRAVKRLWAALVDFANGWREQNFRYKLICWPCMLVSIGVVSLLVYWLIPVISDAAGFWDKFRYCVLIVLASVSGSMLGAFILTYGVYLCLSMLRNWWNRPSSDKAEEPEASPPSADSD